VDEEGRLGVLGQGQLRFRPLPGEAGEVHSQDLVGFLEYPGGLGERIGQLAAHSDELGSLTWEEEGEGHDPE
jgi:hypothetical protein